VEGSRLPLTKLADQVWEAAKKASGASCSTSTTTTTSPLSSSSSSRDVTPETMRNRIINAATRKAYVSKKKEKIFFSSVEEEGRGSGVTGVTLEDDEFGDGLMEEDGGSVWLRWEVRCVRDLGTKEEREACAWARKWYKRCSKVHGKVWSHRHGKGKRENLSELVAEVEALAADLEAASGPPSQVDKGSPEKAAEPLTPHKRSREVEAAALPGQSPGGGTPPAAKAEAANKKRAKLTPEQKKQKEEMKEQKKQQRLEEKRAREEEKERKKQQKLEEQKAREEAARMQKELQEKREREKKQQSLSIFQKMGLQRKTRTEVREEASKQEVKREKPALLAETDLRHLESKLLLTKDCEEKRASPEQLHLELMERVASLKEKGRQGKRVVGQPPPFSRRRLKSRRAGVSVASTSASIIVGPTEMDFEGDCAEVVDLGSGKRKHKKCWRRKLLQFCENRRPAYYGSFTCAQKVVRNPFNRYLGLDYEVDSEEEWDSEPEGEDLMDCSDEEEEELELEEEMAGGELGFNFVVSDDSDSEDDDDYDPEAPEGEENERSVDHDNKLERLVTLAQRKATKLVVDDSELLSVLDPIWLEPPPPPPEKPCSAVTKKEAEPKKKDDKNGKPKRPPNAFFLFQAEEREAVKRDNPDIDPQEMMRELGKRWKEISKERKQAFEVQASKALPEYKERLAKWKLENEPPKPPPAAKEPKKRSSPPKEPKEKDQKSPDSKGRQLKLTDFGSKLASLSSAAREGQEEPASQAPSPPSATTANQGVAS